MHRGALELLWEEGSRCFFTQELQETMRALADGAGRGEGGSLPCPKAFPHSPALGTRLPSFWGSSPTAHHSGRSPWALLMQQAGRAVLAEALFGSPAASAGAPVSPCEPVI